MQAALAIGQPAWDDPHRRMAVCMAISSAAVLLGLALLEWPPSFEWRLFVPVELEISIRQPAGEPETAARELPPAPLAGEAVDPAPSPMPVQAEAPANAVKPAAAEPRGVAATSGQAPSIRVDWYAELERAAAEVSARAAAEPQSMHPEFDELRRIAAQRYGKPQAAPREEAEKDPYDRPPRYRGLVNEYAFGTFEPNMLVFTIPLGRAKPKNLPWVATIRARYEYMRKPDELPPIGISGVKSE